MAVALCLLPSGCTAPPWRQALGPACYMEATQSNFCDPPRAVSRFPRYCRPCGECVSAHSLKPEALKPAFPLPLPAATLLLALPTACRENWSNVTANMTGSEWAPGTPPCGADGTPAWKGVTCDAQGRVVRL